MKEGQKISVTDEQGRELRGRIVRLTPDAVTVSGREGREEVQYAALVKIDTVDDLKNGALIGMGVGLTLFALEAAIARGDGITLNPTGYIVFALMYGGLGAGAGAGLDALIGGNRNIYQRGSAAARFSLTPAVGPDRVRAAVRISW